MVKKSGLGIKFSYLLIGEFISKILQFLFIKYISTTLGVEGMGTYNWVMSNTNMLALVVGLGIDTYMLRTITTKPEKETELISYFIYSKLILLIFSYLLIFIWVNSNSIAYQNFELLMIGSLKLIADAFLFNWVFLAKENVKKVAIRSLILNGSMLVLSLIFIRQKEDIWIALLVNGASNIISSFYLVYHFLPLNISKNFNLKVFKKILNKSLPIGVAYIMTVVYGNSDIIMFGYLREDGTILAGLYGSSIKIITLALIFSNLSQQMLFPRLSKSTNSENRVTVFSNFFDINVMVGFIIAMIIMVFSKQLILIQFDKTFLDASPILMLLTIKLLLGYMNVSISTTLIAWDMQGLVMKIISFSALLNIILNYIFIPAYGMEAAALTTIVTEVLVVGISFGVTSKQFGRKLLYKPIAYLLIFLAFAYLFAEYILSIDSIPLGILLIIVSSLIIYVFPNSLKVKTILEYVRK